MFGEGNLLSELLSAFILTYVFQKAVLANRLINENNNSFLSQTIQI